MPWKYPPPSYPKPAPPARGPLPSLRYPPAADVMVITENMKSAAEVLSTWNGIYSKERCVEKIRIAETYLAIAKEKLEKL